METKGFTLIELMIVVAIIGILASIVFVNLASSRNQAKDAAIQADLDSMRFGAEQIYEVNGSYSTVCDPGAVSKIPYDAAEGNGYNNNGKKGVCQPSQYKWAACVYENINGGSADATAWCVDNTGVNKRIPTAGCDAILNSASPACL
jgi:prepilin-type N-terminal cleavage/methylation domain-containing protein